MLMALDQNSSTVDRREPYFEEWLAGTVKKFPYLLTASQQRRQAHRDAEVAGVASRRWIKEAESSADKKACGIMRRDHPYDPAAFARISARQAAHLAFVAQPDLRALEVLS